jgi:hypothetical protein
MEQSKVYVLCSGVQHEGEQLISVHSSVVSAQSRMGDEIEQSRWHCIDFYSIYECKIDGDGERYEVETHWKPD